MTLSHDVPVFIICRDRLTPLVELLDYLERAGCERIHLLDNDSTYPPLLEFYERTPHHLIRLGDNLGHKSLWLSGVLDDLGVRGPFVLSDPDTVPIEECPLDAIDYFAEVLDRYPGYTKAGFGLRIDDLPDHFRHKADVIAWEAGFWQCALAPRLYEAPIDTTFALHRGAEDQTPRGGIRTGYPYLVRHTTWYLDSDNLPDEERFYRERARADVMSWGGEAIRSPLDELIGKLGLREGPAIEDAPRVGATEAGAGLVAAGSAWRREPRPVDETEYTAFARPGWHAWNDMSPEVEFCDFAAALVRLVQPPTLIETGTGQGFMTRRVREQIGPGQQLLCFESDAEWREALRALPCFDGRICALSPKEEPDDADFAGAALTVLDSGDFRRRFREVEAWWRAARPGALVLVHDAGNGHAPETPHARLRALIQELGIPGVFLKNPRGGFLGLKPEQAG
jgi:hypothetical protein